jgi:dipeptidyl aminopeptidase/acylaminoacyl peptidase
MNADGSEQRALTRGHLPDWSPDGTHIAFESLRHGPLEIYTMDSDGDDVRRLTRTDTDNHEPSWSPDGTRIMYVSNRGVSSDNYEIIVMDANGGDEVNLTNDGANDMGAAWRPIAPPTQLWARTFGGPLFDSAGVVRRTRDGGFIVGGATVSFSDGGFDLWLNKLDRNGLTLWSQIYGGISDDDVTSILEIDDGYVIAGITESFGSGDEDFWLISTTTDGSELWSRTFGGPALDRAESLQHTPDGGFVIGGRTMSFGAGREDAWLIRTDEDGNEIWSRSYGGAWDDDAYAVLVTDDGGYVLCGHSGTDEGEFDMWIAKVDEQGMVVWEQTFGETGWDNAYSCLESRDGGYVLAGYTESSSGDDLDVWLVKTDGQGSLIWESVFRGSGRDTAFSVRETRDGGYVLSGSSDSYGDGDSDIWLGGTDARGNFLWTTTLGGEEDDYGFGLDLTSDGGYIVGGYTYSFGEGNGDGYVVRLRRERQPQGPPCARKDISKRPW